MINEHTTAHEQVRARAAAVRDGELTTTSPEPEEPTPGDRFDRWRLCAHADDSRPAHWLAPGDRCVSPALSEDH